jgi:hypothetical protein
MSCTSVGVGEMWNSQGTLKINGKTPVLELIYFPGVDKSGMDETLFTLKTSTTV